jgi:hypothetical protein
VFCKDAICFMCNKSLTRKRSAGLLFHFSGAMFAAIFALLFLQDMTFYLNRKFVFVVAVVYVREC